MPAVVSSTGRAAHDRVRLRNRCTATACVNRFSTNQPVWKSACAAGLNAAPAVCRNAAKVARSASAVTAPKQSTKRLRSRVSKVRGRRSGSVRSKASDSCETSNSRFCTRICTGRNGSVALAASAAHTLPTLAETVICAPAVVTFNAFGPFGVTAALRVQGISTIQVPAT